MIKLILDTDIADDIDDAFALDFILKNSDQIELLGVVTVFKNVLERAQVAKKIIRLNKKNIPVYMGENKPVKNDISYFHYEDGKHLLSYKPDLDHEKVEEMSGVDFILKTIRENPHEITLLGIGPVTDIAKAIQKDLEAMKLVKQILLMNGTNNLNRVYVKEWNVLVDPEAEKVVLESELPVRFVPGEITCQSTLTDEELKQVFNKNNPSALYINEMLKEWMDANKRMPVLHDVLPIYSLLNKDCFHFKKVVVEVPLEEEHRGSLAISEDEKSNKEVAVTFDRQTFMEYFMNLY